MKSRTGLPNTHIAGESPVVGSGQFQYCKMALCSLSVSKLPFGPVFSAISLLAVLTPISDLQFECGKDTEEKCCLTPQFFRNVVVAPDVNSGPPSDDSSSGMFQVSIFGIEWDAVVAIPTVEKLSSSVQLVQSRLDEKETLCGGSP